MTTSAQIIELLEKKIAASQNLQDDYAERAKTAFWSFGDESAKINRDRFNKQRNWTNELRNILTEIRK